MNDLKNEFTTIALEDAAPLVTLPDEAHQHSQHERILQLLYALHSSLDIKTIIQQFAQGVRQEIVCDSIGYQYDPIRTVINIGKEKSHTFSYELTPNGDNLGTIIFSRSTAFSKQEIIQLENLLCFLLNPLHNAIEHLKALQSALRDPLTQLANRTALDSTLHRDIELAKRHHMPFSILALDLDHFKQVNDNYGHAGGDALLKAVASHIQECVRESDIVFRTGGEEFIVLLDKTDTQGAINLADRICHSISSLHCIYNKQEILITISIGVASYVSGDSETSLLEKADKALYRAKQEGRNRVTI